MSTHHSSQALISELGEDGYREKVAKDALAHKLKQEKERLTKSLESSLRAVLAACGNGIAPTLDGLSIGKTAAKSDWNIRPTELGLLTAVDATKKQPKYHLRDVIRLAHEKPHHRATTAIVVSTGRRIVQQPKEQHISDRLKSTDKVAQSKLYACFLQDIYLNERAKADSLEGGEEVVKAAFEEIRGSVTKAVMKAKVELKAEENRLSALDSLEGSSGKKRSASNEEESEDDSEKKPTAKKRRKVTAAKKKIAASNGGVGKVAGVTDASRGRRSGRGPVSYAEANSEDET